MNKQQLDAFADTHLWRLPFDTSPRHLAGPGDARHVTHGLAAAGWTRTSDPLSSEIVLRSPDHRLTLQFDPQSATSAWWRLRTEPIDTERSWYAEFGELVPAEILGSLTDALIGPPPTQQPDPFHVLKAAGWTIDIEEAAVSPDDMCYVRQRHNGGRHRTWHWHVETCEPGYGTPMGPRIWHAWIDGHAPAHLMNAFVTALAHNAPLRRALFDHTVHHSAVQKPSRLTPGQVVEAHTARLDTVRAQARATRRQQQPNPTTATPVKASTPRPTARR